MRSINSYKKARVVKVKTANGKITKEVIKDGVIVERTSCGARIYNPKDPAESIQFAEWFPNESKAGICIEEQE